MGLLLPKLSLNVSVAGTRQLTKPPPMLHPKRCPAGTKLMPVLKLLDIPLRTHLQTADGMKPPVALKAVKPQGPLLVPECGTRLLATHLPVLPHQAETRLAMPHLVTGEPQEAFAKIAGMRPQRLRGRPQDMGAAGLRPQEQIEEKSQWAKLRLQEPVRGSLGGMKPLPARWAPQHHFLPQEKLP